MNRNNNNSNQSSSKEILAARLAFIGASIATLGDGLSAIAAGIALDILENPSDAMRSQHQTNQFETSQQLDLYINELINLRNNIT
ncbi:translation initiation factor 2 [Paenibacillus yanchengensis]|uniref:Translation initiation factor 2 n=1 Tax=Paenibacillus yanchengensis TaxID=2035833 RepID=A0ABW4YGJ3_9BACL